MGFVSELKCGMCCTCRGCYTVDFMANDIHDFLQFCLMSAGIFNWIFLTNAEDKGSSHEKP